MRHRFSALGRARTRAEAAAGNEWQANLVQAAYCSEKFESICLVPYTRSLGVAHCGTIPNTANCLDSPQCRALTTGARMTNTPGDLQSRAPSADAVQPHISATPPAAANRARERLATAIVAACRARADDDVERTTSALRTSVGDYIAALRDDGATVEYAVISTKEILAETIGGPNIPPERRALAEQVVSWGIDAYYDSHTRAD